MAHHRGVEARFGSCRPAGGGSGRRLRGGGGTPGDGGRRWLHRLGGRSDHGRPDPARDSHRRAARDHRPGGGGPGPVSLMRPRQAAALAMTALLALAVVGPWRSGEQRGDAAAPDPGATVPPPPSPSAPTTVRSTMADTTAVKATVPSGEQDAVAVIRQGLAAWGRFAASGDLGEVEPWFAVEGPQYLQFIEEAGAAPA